MIHLLINWLHILHPFLDAYRYQVSMTMTRNIHLIASLQMSDIWLVQYAPTLQRSGLNTVLSSVCWFLQIPLRLLSSPVFIARIQSLFELGTASIRSNDLGFLEDVSDLSLNPGSSAFALRLLWRLFNCSGRNHIMRVRLMMGTLVDKLANFDFIFVYRSWRNDTCSALWTRIILLKSRIVPSNWLFLLWLNRRQWAFSFFLNVCERLLSGRHMNRDGSSNTLL